MGAVLNSNENQLEKRQTVGLYCPGQYTVQHRYIGKIINILSNAAYR